MKRRLCRLTLTVFLVIFLSLGIGDREHASGQLDLVELSREKLLEAFLAVRDADLSGVSAEEIEGLTDDLDLALALQQRANATGSQPDASLSISLSSQVSAEARRLKAEATAQSFRTGVLTYSLVFWAAAVSSVVGVEWHRISNFVRRLRAERHRIMSRNPRI